MEPPKNLPEMLKCEECEFTMDAPKHCRAPMHLEEVDGVLELVCWMGSGCGHQTLPEHEHNAWILVHS